MNNICDFCSRQTNQKHSGGTQCGYAVYQNEEYGEFKQGSRCVYDSELIVAFQKRGNEEINVKNMASVINNQDDELMVLREKVRLLEDRLTAINI